MARIDLIVPARNEAENLPALFDALPRVRLRRVVVADNGSTDGTAELARQRGAVVVHEPSPGYGGACLAAMAWIAGEPHGETNDDRGCPSEPASAGGRCPGEPASAGGRSHERSSDLEPQTPPGDRTPPDAVAFLDADLSDDPAELPRLIDAVVKGGADLAIGTRTARAEPGALELHQRFGNALACRLIAWSCGRRFRDLGPMRVIRWDALLRLEMRDRTWGWMVEMNYKAASRGLKVVELDVPYRKRHAGRSKISGSLIGSWKAGTKILTTIIDLHRSERRERLGVKGLKRQAAEAIRNP
ncbi:MAG: glycosyltransferase family 2 protein [Phycisphaeraceae bacterium]